MPEVSEIEIIRHFTRLSTWNYAIDLGMYPLGSLHHEVQPAGERIGIAAGWDCERRIRISRRKFRRVRCAS